MPESWEILLPHDKTVLTLKDDDWKEASFIGHQYRPPVNLFALYGQIMAQHLIAKEPRDMNAPDEPIIVQE